MAQWTSGAKYAPTSIAVSWPHAPAAGDVLVAALWNNGQSTGAANTYTPPAGWTAVDGNTVHAYASYQVFTHVVVSGETNSYAFTPIAAQREQLWIAADVTNAAGVEAAANAFLNTAATYTTPALTPANGSDLALAFNLPVTSAANSATWTNAAPWSLGAGPTPTWHGEALYQALSSTAQVSESATLSANATGFAGIVLLKAAGVPLTPTPPPTTTPAPTPTPTSAASAPSASQWTSGSAYAPASITLAYKSTPGVGHVLVVAFWNNGQTSGASNGYTPPAGWTLLDQNTTHSFATLQIYTHVVASGESGSYAFTPVSPVREHVWIGVDISGAGAIDAHAAAFISNTASYTTPSLAPSQSNDLALAFDLPFATSTLAWTNPSGWTAGTGPTPQWRGQTLYQTLSSTAAVSESATLSGSASGFAAIMLVSPLNVQPTPTPVPTPTPTLTFSDWPTFGDNLSRTQFNGHETTLSAANAGGLKLLWKDDLGAAITAQPVIATNVNIGGTPKTVAYVGAENGTFYALDADTGVTLWTQTLSTLTSACMDLPGGVFGITATATYDKNTNRVYVADAHAQVHALDMSSGNEATGWPVTISTSFTKNYIYSGLALNPANGYLYVTTASYCDNPNWLGEIAAIDTSSGSIVDTFFPATPYNGDGIWGEGGPAIDASNNVYVTTGNTVGATSESAGYGDALVALSSTLSVSSSSGIGIASGDIDFGASPSVYQPQGCPQMISAKNKDGVLYTWNAASIASGPIQSLAMAPNTSFGRFVGGTTYSPNENLFYVGVPAGNTTFTHGIVALRPQSDCTLALAWQQTAGPSSITDNDNHSVTVANGVAYLTTGIGDAVYAYNATTGAPLWNSGSAITGPTMIAPTVDGHLYVSSWDHNLYAFGL